MWFHYSESWKKGFLLSHFYIAQQATDILANLEHITKRIYILQITRESGHNCPYIFMHIYTYSINHNVNLELFTFFFSRLIILSQIRRNLSSSTCTRALTQGLNQGFRIAQIKQHSERWNYIKPVSFMNTRQYHYKQCMAKQLQSNTLKSIIGCSEKKKKGSRFMIGTYTQVNFNVDNTSGFIRCFARLLYASIQ